MMAHGRFFSNDGKTKYDVAFGQPIKVVEPEVAKAVDVGAMLGLVLASFSFWVLLTAPPFYQLWLLAKSKTGEAINAELVELALEMLSEGILDAIEMGSALLILSALKSDLSALEIHRCFGLCCDSRHHWPRCLHSPCSLYSRARLGPPPTCPPIRFIRCLLLCLASCRTRSSE